MIALRYDLITATEEGIQKHPEEILKELGYTVLKWHSAPIGDCIFIGVDKAVEPLPKYLAHSNFKFE